MNRLPPVGLLLVHGIGQQQPGDTLDGLLGALREAYGQALQVERVDTLHARVHGVGRPVHLHEVHWADLLHGPDVRGSFDMARVFRAVWMPRLNAGADAWHGHRHAPGPARVRLWTWLLAPASVVLSASLYGVGFLAAAVQARSRRAPGDTHTRTLVDDLMDEFTADVFNYVDGTAGAFAAPSPQTDRIRQQVRCIGDRLAAAAARARAGGCTELQVLAHSLGSVIAFRELSRGAPGATPGSDPAPPCAAGAAVPGAAQAVPVPTPEPAPARLTHFWTIGSPLEKFRFFWPALVPGAPAGPALWMHGHCLARPDTSGLAWHNYSSLVDLVSGQLQPFHGWPAPHNHRPRGLGGLISSHVAYLSHPDFVAELGAQITGTRPVLHVGWARRWRARLRSVAENLALPLLLLASAALGLAVVLSLASGLGWLMGRPLLWLGWPGGARGMQTAWEVLILIGLVAPLAVARREAAALHARYWTDRGAPPQDGKPAA